LNLYADTSFFVSLYLPDRHSAEARRRLAHEPTIWMTPLHRAEWAHAIAQHVFQGKMSHREAQRVYRDFEHDRAHSLWAEVDLPDNTFESCIDLAHRYVARLGARTLDSVHVAAALELGAQQFWTFDERQAKLAAAVGLTLT